MSIRYDTPDSVPLGPKDIPTRTIRQTFASRRSFHTVRLRGVLVNFGRHLDNYYDDAKFGHSPSGGTAKGLSPEEQDIIRTLKKAVQKAEEYFGYDLSKEERDRRAFLAYEKFRVLPLHVTRQRYRSTPAEKDDGDDDSPWSP